MRKLMVMVMLGSMISVLFTGVVGAESNKRFSDIINHWAKEDIAHAVERGIVQGYPDGTFRPDNSVTRAEFIKMLIMALEIPLLSDEGQWYQPYVTAAIETEYHREADFKDNYDQKMTRIEMVKIAVRAISQTGGIDHSKFINAEYMLEAVSKGIILGTGKGNLAEGDLTTRAQSLTVIDRILDLREGKTLTVDQNAIQSAKQAVDEAYGHLALRTGQLYDIDDLSIIDDFYAKEKDTMGYESVEEFRQSVKGVRDIVEKIKVVIDNDNKQFIVTTPEYSQKDYNVIFSTFANGQTLNPGTYVVKFDEVTKSGIVYRVSINEQKINGYVMYSHWGYTLNGTDFTTIEGSPGYELLYGGL